MQMNHSENCGKCHSNHWLGVNCKGKLIKNWEQDLINSNVAIIDLRKQSGAMIYIGEQPTTAGFIKDQIKIYEDSRKKYEFSFEQNENDIRFLVYLFKSTDAENHYSLYYKFEKDKSTKKEISRTNIFKYDLLKYVETDMLELKRNFYSKYIELETICLNLQTA